MGSVLVTLIVARSAAVLAVCMPLGDPGAGARRQVCRSLYAVGCRHSYNDTELYE